MGTAVSLTDAGRSGGRITLLTQAVRLIASIVSLMVLSRLVAPESFGIIAMAMAFVGIGDIIRDMGLAGASIQAKRITQAQRSNLFWLNTAVGGAFAILCVGIAPTLASYFSQPSVAEVTVVLAWVFLLNGIQTQAQADLTRSFRFRALSFSQLGAFLAGVVVAIICASLGMELWALVAQYVVQASVLCVTRLLLSGWIPSLPKRGAGMRSLIRFGYYTTLVQLIAYAGNNFHSWFLGRLVGADMLGQYARGYQIFMMPTLQLLNPLTAVAHSTMSRMQDDMASVSRSIRNLSLVLGYPIALCCAVLVGAPDDVVRVLLGPGWDTVPEIVSALAIGGIVLGVNRAVTWTFSAMGLTREYFHTMLVTRLILIALMVGGYFSFGIIGLALGHSVGLILSWPLNARALGKHVTVYSSYWRGSIRIIILAAAVATSMRLCGLILGDGTGEIIRLSIELISAFLVVSVLAVIPVYRRDFKDCFRMVLNRPK